MAVKKSRVRPLRGSERGDFKTCQQLWEWAWRYGYRPVHEKANALWFGGGIHLCLAHWYQPQGRSQRKGFIRGAHPAETWQKWAKNERYRFFPRNGPGLTDEKDFVDMVDLGEAMLTAYVEYWGEDESWEFLAPELPFSVVLADHQNKPLVNFFGTFDGAYRDHGDDYKVKVLETKTAASISAAPFLALQDQPNGYGMVAGPVLRDLGYIGEEEYVTEITYNFLRKAMPDERPTNEKGERLNKDGTVSKRQPPAYFRRHPEVRWPKDHEQTFKHIVNEAKQMQLIVDGVVQPTKNPGFLGENCRRCSFQDMCVLHEAGDDWQEFAEQFLVQQDPYADHRQGAKSSKF